MRCFVEMEGYALRHCVGCMEQGWEGANLDNTYFPRCAVATSAHAYYLPIDWLTANIRWAVPWLRRVSNRPVTAQTRTRSQTSLWDLWWKKVSLGQGFLQVLRFSLHLFPKTPDVTCFTPTDRFTKFAFQCPFFNQMLPQPKLRQNDVIR